MRNNIIVALLLLSILGCSKKDDNNNTADGRVAVAGGSAINGHVNISPECGTSANLWITTNNSSQSMFNTTVGNGGSFNFQLTSGTYVLNAVSNNQSCSVSAQLQTLTNSVAGYTVCLGSNCNQTALNPGVNTTTVPTNSPYYDPGFMSGPPCQWDIYGCSGSMYPGYGLVGVGKPNIYFTAKTDTDFSLDLEFTIGNNDLASIPSLGKNGWKGTIKKSGQIEIGKGQFDFLFYDTQVDEHLLQFESGFCDPQDKIVAHMSEYLKLAGFTDKTVGEFEKHWKNHMPPNEKLCAYPQDMATIAKAVNYKSSVPMEVRKLWFIVIPYLESSVLKIKKMPKEFVQTGKPKADAFAVMKKTATNRAVANEAPLLAEEWGVGFLLVR